MNQEKVYSVIIPAHNEEHFIANTLESVMNQSYNPQKLEIIVVNNASSDNTREVALKYLENKTLVSKVVDEPILGVSRTKNTGANYAQGDVLVFLDADSVMKDDLIEKINNHYEISPAGMIKTVPREHNLTTKLFWGFLEFGKTYFPRPAGESYCDRKLFLKVGGFDESLSLAEDTDFLMRVRAMLQKEEKRLGYVKDSEIATSSRRMEKTPFKLGYLTTLTHWGFAYWGFLRKTYRRMNSDESK